ncbi:hypothetical protein RclHR1_00370018 [Rhizophagus clarus]|uniref:Uncharacterized protein n=1 Tax=Rhizophagus clarus TaxID=94130 RepID=A0A2Z6RBX5_9GLOM|nr:hypothetical protein RclHR1_00370018 [Rhizophagus clarus]
MSGNRWSGCSKGHTLYRSTVAGGSKVNVVTSTTLRSVAAQTSPLDVTRIKNKRVNWLLSEILRSVISKLNSDFDHMFGLVKGVVGVEQDSNVYWGRDS